MFSYQLDSNINPNTAFAYDPIPEISLAECKELPQNWTDQFSHLCGFNDVEKAALVKHMDTGYKYHVDLLHHVRKAWGQI